MSGQTGPLKAEKISALDPISEQSTVTSPKGFVQVQGKMESGSGHDGSCPLALHNQHIRRKRRERENRLDPISKARRMGRERTTAIPCRIPR